MSRVTVLGLCGLMTAVLLAVTSACSRQPGGQRATSRPACLLPADAELRPGDVVFRRGEGLMSHVVMAADHQGNYSHTGIVADSCGSLLIVHAVPGEPDFEGDPDRVKADRPEQFFASQRASIGEVCRAADADIARQAAAVAWQVYQRGTPFDHDYDDLDTTRMYCTELVAFAFRQAGINLVEGRGHHINLPFMQTDCVMPSDIYQSRFLRSIIKF